MGRFATVGPGGRPHIVPLCYAASRPALYWSVDAKPKRSPRLRRLENLRTNPGVSLLVDEWSEDWTRLWWVRADGRARIVEEADESSRALALLAAKYAQYRASPPPGPVVAIDVERLVEWIWA